MTFAVRIVNVRIKPDWKPIITHHAIIRYVERAMGVNIEAVREAMQNEMTKKAIVYGAGYVTCGSVKLVIDGGKVVTVLGKKMHPKNQTIHAAKRAERLMQELDA